MARHGSWGRFIKVEPVLMPSCFSFDAFRSIFPAGTVSGAPKIKAIELVGGLEQERRGVYAGAVGRFDFNENELDTCIAIRTMTFKDGVAYLQAGKQAYREPRVTSWFLTPQRIAGGGIVFDSVEEDEYIETINKLGANVRCIDAAEGKYQSFSRLRISPDMLDLQNITPRWSAPHKIGHVSGFHRQQLPMHDR
jgi:anthranilate synthase component 1